MRYYEEKFKAKAVGKRTDDYDSDCSVEVCDADDREQALLDRIRNEIAVCTKIAIEARTNNEAIFDTIFATGYGDCDEDCAKDSIGYADQILGALSRLREELQSNYNLTRRLRNKLLG